MKIFQTKSLYRVLVMSIVIWMFQTLDVHSMSTAQVQSGQKTAVHNRSLSSPVAEPTPGNQDPVSNQTHWNGFDLLKNVHPLIFAAAQLLIVFGVCILLTDNKELELYLKIDFRPPKIDILN